MKTLMKLEAKDIKKIFRFRVPNLTLVLGSVLILGGWLWAFFALRNTSQPLILHFSEQGGINQVGYAGDLARVGVFGLVVLAVNFLISVEVEERGRFLGRLTSVATAFLAILIFIYFAAIIGVN